MTLPPLQDVIRHYGLQAKKSLGQNFLLDPNLLHRIAREAGDLNGCDVFEVGPGPGGLTRALLALGARVTAIEKDARFLAPLQDLQQVYPDQLFIHQEDALKIHPQSLMRGPFKIVANLPYNIGTHLLTTWLQNCNEIKSFTLLLQKEVVKRIVAPHSTADYGRLSVLCQYRCITKRCFDVPPSAFVPRPKVVSSVVHLQPKELTAQQLAVFAKIQQLTQAGFSQRRKMIRRSLSGFFTDEQLVAAGFDPQARAETLSVNDFEKMAICL